MTGYQSKRAAAQSKLVVTDIDGHVVRDARKPKKAQPEQETVGFVDSKLNPIQRQPLTDEQIEDIAAKTMFPINFARAIEAAHGIKENT